MPVRTILLIIGTATGMAWGLDPIRVSRALAAAMTGLCGVRPIMGYLLALLAGLIIVAIFPWISIGFL